MQVCNNMFFGDLSQNKKISVGPVAKQLGRGLTGSVAQLSDAMSSYQ